jgi:hypothetical protein
MTLKHGLRIAGISANASANRNNLNAIVPNDAA